MGHITSDQSIVVVSSVPPKFIHKDSQISLSAKALRPSVSVRILKNGKRPHSPPHATWLSGPIALIATLRFIGNCALEPTLLEERLQVLAKEMNPVLEPRGPL
jgi:hypothetical protein